MCAIRNSDTFSMQIVHTSFPDVSSFLEAEGEEGVPPGVADGQSQRPRPLLRDRNTPWSPWLSPWGDLERW